MIIKMEDGKEKNGEDGERNDFRIIEHYEDEGVERRRKIGD